MPRGNRTGPAGQGPMTGRAAGYCASYPESGYANPGRGQGMGWGGRAGRGWRHRHWWYDAGPPRWMQYGNPPGWEAPPAGDYPSPATREQEAASLSEQAHWLGDQLRALNERIAELEEEAQKSEDE